MGPVDGIALGMFKALAAEQQFGVFAEPASGCHAVGNVAAKRAAVTIIAAPAEPSFWVLLAGALNFRLIWRRRPWDARAGPPVLATAARSPTRSFAFRCRHALSVVEHGAVLAQAAATIFLVPAWGVRACVAISTARAQCTIARRGLSFAFRSCAAALSWRCWWRRRCRLRW